MPRGMTIAQFVSSVYHQMYGVFLDNEMSPDGMYHAKSDKFKEVVLEGRVTLERFLSQQDWNFMVDYWQMGPTMNPDHGGIQEFTLPDDCYKVCTGYNDAVRLHPFNNRSHVVAEALWTPRRSGSTNVHQMHDAYGRPNVYDNSLQAFVVGDTVTFNRRFNRQELNCMAETHIIRYFKPLHICTDDCPDDCPKSYKELILTEIPDPLYIVQKTAASRCDFDPSKAERGQKLDDEAQKLLSSMREHDSASTMPDTYKTSTIGFIPVL